MAYQIYPEDNLPHLICPPVNVGTKVAQSTADIAVRTCNSVDIIGGNVITIQSVMYVVVTDEGRGMDDMSVATKLHRLPIGAAAADRWCKRAGFLWCSTANSPSNRPQTPILTWHALRRDGWACPSCS